MKNKIKYWRSILALLTLFSFGAIISNATADQSGLRIPEQVTGDLAYDHLCYLTEEIGVRVTGTEGAEDAADYIIDQFLQMGYEVEIQPFTFERRGTLYESENIIATKHGKFDQTVIVGAHYDSVSERVCADGNVSSGAGDNASGVGVMLEVAEVLTNYKTKGTVKFIAFGAEEMGFRGSRYYADQMSEEDIANTVTMIDLDSVGVGDFFYVYAGLEDNPGWARDLALKIGQGMGYDLRTSPQSEFFDGGTTGDWSDHVPFRLLGIPIAYFEWMNWDIEPDGGIETEEFGWVMHTCMDNLSFVSHAKLEFTADVVASLVFELSKTKLPRAEKGKIAKGNKYISIQKRSDLPN
ncbi:MAG: M20/M25/M40 family metallo-hydrolase [Desulfobacterales bacterium]|nr:MAG: M20/M25/M40 family metallo-hydrolase [Desulfobacterales bacterium]